MKRLGYVLPLVLGLFFVGCCDRDAVQPVYYPMYCQPCPQICPQTCVPSCSPCTPATTQPQVRQTAPITNQQAPRSTYAQ